MPCMASCHSVNKLGAHNRKRLNMRVITKLPNTEHFSKGKGKYHKSTNRQSQSTTVKLGRAVMRNRQSKNRHDKRTNNDPQNITKKTMIEQHYRPPSKRE